MKKKNQLETPDIDTQLLKTQETAFSILKERALEVDFCQGMASEDTEH